MTEYYMNVYSVSYYIFMLSEYMNGKKVRVVSNSSKTTVPSA
jgi:hypothetical protein